MDLHILSGQLISLHGTSIPSMTFIHEIVFKMQDKITGPQNIGHIDLHIHLGQLWCNMESISLVRVHPSNSLQDTKQNLCL